MTSSFSIIQFFERLWRNPIIKQSMRDHYGEFGDRLLWAMKEGLLYIDPGDIPEFLSGVVVRSAHPVDTLYGHDANGYEFQIQIMEFDHIYSFRVNDITFGFFSSIKAAKNHAREKYRDEIDAHRQAKKLRPKHKAPEPDYLGFWNEFHERFNPFVGEMPA